MPFEGEKAITPEEIAKKLFEHCRNQSEAQGLEGPFVHGNQFAVVFDIDCTDKSGGQRWHAKEVGLYEVSEGKIVKESFFMVPMG